MAIGFKHGSSGGNLLGITVVSGTARPSVAKENSIWVNSATAVDSWVIAPTEPDGAVGRFWIKTDPSGTVSVDALKGKNRIEVRPVSVYEYVTNGGWEERDAEVYQSGAWGKFEALLYIYNKGKSTGYSMKCNELMKQTNSGHTAAAGRVTVGESSITVATLSTRGYDFTNIFVTDASESFTKVDLSKWSKIRIKGTVSGASKITECVFRVMSAMGNLCTENNVASQSFTTGVIDATIDVSAIDSSCYLGFTFYNDTSTPSGITFELTELWLE